MGRTAWRWVRRWLFVVAVITVAVGSGFGSAVAIQPFEPASLTIHARSCPPRYIANAHFEDCHDDLLTGVGYTAEGSITARAETGAEGNAVFAGLPAGAYTFEDADSPFEFIDRLDRFCSEVGAPGKAVPFVATGRGVRIDLAAGERIVCDFYYVGADLRGSPTATLTIHNRLCPADFAGRDYYGACHDTAAPADLEFLVDGPDTAAASTDERGNTAVRVAEGRYNVRGGVPGEFARLAVFCARTATPGVAFPISPILGGPRGTADPVGIVVELAGGDDIACDWYNTPESGR